MLQEIKTQIKSVKDQSSYEIQDLKLEIQHLQLALQIHDLKKFREEAFEEDMAALGSDDECLYGWKYGHTEFLQQSDNASKKVAFDVNNYAFESPLNCDSNGIKLEDQSEEIKLEDQSEEIKRLNYELQQKKHENENLKSQMTEETTNLKYELEEKKMEIKILNDKMATVVEAIKITYNQEK